jgi:hypothetical protein
VAVWLLAALALAVVRQERIRGLVRLISGLLVVLVVLRPLPSLNWAKLSEELFSVADGEFDSSAVEKEYQRRLRENIQNNTQRYIEEKAAELGAFVRAEVELSEEEYPVPIGVRLVGIVDYRQLTELSTFISESLGIPMERQEWTMNEAD